MHGIIALRRWSIRFALAVGAFCAAAAVHAGPTFSRMVVFGDSLSDTGNTRNVVGANSGLIANLAGYGNNGRFSNGVLWHETMAPLIGESVATASRVAGPNNYNYAYGGARVDNLGAHPRACSRNTQIRRLASDQLAQTPTRCMQYGQVATTPEIWLELPTR